MPQMPHLSFEKKSHDFQNLVHPDRYQVFLLSCLCGLPISFAKHQWFVVNQKGKLSRFEVLIVPNYRGESWGHLHKNMKAPFEPLGTFTMAGKALLSAELLGVVEGGEGSLAQKVAEFIENSPSSYPFCNDYNLWSPNSNSYVRWVLSRFPEFKVKIPWNAFGKVVEGRV